MSRIDTTVPPFPRLKLEPRRRWRSRYSVINRLPTTRLRSKRDIGSLKPLFHIDNLGFSPRLPTIETARQDVFVSDPLRVRVATSTEVIIEDIGPAAMIFLMNRLNCGPAFNANAMPRSQCDTGSCWSQKKNLGSGVLTLNDTITSGLSVGLN